MAHTKKLNFNPPLDQLYQTRSTSFYTTFSGGNNSGKSLVLKNLKSFLGKKAYMVSPARFYHVADLSTQRYDPNDYENWNNQFNNQLADDEMNHEHNYIDLGRVISSLSDKKRFDLLKICGELIGGTFSLKKRDPLNELSHRYVDVDGQKLSVASTGTRLLLTIVGLCLDDQFEIMLIDEPELGLSPKVQASLAKFFADDAMRKRHFSHLTGIFVATHSHLFIDRKTITNNFVVSKIDKDVTVEQMKTIGELHNLQFNLLGNTFESMFFPSAVVIVEGKTDKPFIEKVVQIKYPESKILVLEGQGDVKRALRDFARVTGDFERSPFRPRTFVILDSVHVGTSLSDLVNRGAKDSNIIEWSNNGIEFVYPHSLVAEAFCCATEEIGNISIIGDNLSLNGLTMRKVELAKFVIDRMGKETQFPDELNSKFIVPLGLAIET